MSDVRSAIQAAVEQTFREAGFAEERAAEWAATAAAKAVSGLNGHVLTEEQARALAVLRGVADVAPAPAKRGRGRPKGSGVQAKAKAEPVKARRGKDVAPKKAGNGKRGRPKGSKNKPKAEAAAPARQGKKKRGRPKGSKNKPKAEASAPATGKPQRTPVLVDPGQGARQRSPEQRAVMGFNRRLVGVQKRVAEKRATEEDLALLTDIAALGGDKVRAREVQRILATEAS